MSAINAPVQALTKATDPATTLVALTIAERIEYPLGHTTGLDRASAKHLRRLERSTRIAMRAPDRATYASHTGDTWHVLLAPHTATVRVYLSRAGTQHHYCPGTPAQAPQHAPGTLLASWSNTRVEHAFSHVLSDEQLALVMYFSTASSHLYIAPATPRDGLACPYTLAMKTQP